MKMTRIGAGLGPALALLVAAASCTFSLPGTSPAGRGLDLRPSSLSGGGQPFAVVATDLDRDGKIDLAVSNSKTSSISIYLGRGDGTFQELTHIPTGRWPRGLVAADFNGDGALDLAVAATREHAVFVHPGLGNGRFGPSESFAVGLRPFMLEPADFNQDGQLDLVVANEGERAQGQALSVLLGDGRGRFSVTSFSTGKHGSDVAVADFNRDGQVDVAVSTWGTNDVNLHLGRGDGSFVSPRSFTYRPRTGVGHGIYRVLAADLDRDGNADMVWNDLRRSALYVLYGDGQGAFPRTRVLPAGPGVRHAVASDLNGDGWLDLASANTGAGEISVILSDGKGAFLPPQNFATGVLPRMVAAADLNGDQRLDLVVTNLRSDDITVFLNRGPAPLRLVAAESLEQFGLPGDEAQQPAASDARLELEWEYKFRSGSDANAAYGVAVDESGGIYLAGDVGSGADWRILHLGPDGKKRWSFDFDGESVEVPYALTLTPDGQVVAAGAVFGGRETHSLVVSVSRKGEENWRYEDSGKRRQILRGIVSDGDGNLYAVGESDGRWKVLSLSPAGQLRWSYQGDRGTARAVAADARGHVFVAGNERGVWRVMQLGPDGRLVWQHGLESASPYSPKAHGIGLHPSGAVVSGSQPGGQVRVEKLDAEGQRLWVYLVSKSRGAIGRAVDIDPEGNAVVVGELAGNWLMLGLDPNGRLLWRFTYDGGGGLRNPDQAHAVAFHPSGGFVVAGAVHPLPPEPPSLGPVDWRVARYRVVNAGD